MGRLDAFQGLSLEEERAQGLYDAPCTCCGDACSALSLDRDGRCPDCADDHRAELDAEDPESALYAELCELCDARSAYDHEADVRAPWHIGWSDAEEVCS